MVPYKGSTFLTEPSPIPKEMIMSPPPVSSQILVETQETKDTALIIRAAATSQFDSGNSPHSLWAALEWLTGTALVQDRLVSSFSRVVMALQKDTSWDLLTPSDM